MLMTNADLADIEHRAALFVDEGDRDALRPQDVTMMMQEIREARAIVVHLIAEVRHAQPWGQL